MRFVFKNRKERMFNISRGIKFNESSRKGSESLWIPSPAVKGQLSRWKHTSSRPEAVAFHHQIFNNKILLETTTNKNEIRLRGIKVRLQNTTKYGFNHKLLSIPSVLHKIKALAIESRWKNVVLFSREKSVSVKLLRDGKRILGKAWFVYVLVAWESVSHAGIFQPQNFPRQGVSHVHQWKKKSSHRFFFSSVHTPFHDALPVLTFSTMNQLLG